MSQGKWKVQSDLTYPPSYRMWGTPEKGIVEHIMEERLGERWRLGSYIWNKMEYVLWIDFLFRLNYYLQGRDYLRELCVDGG